MHDKGFIIPVPSYRGVDIKTGGVRVTISLSVPSSSWVYPWGVALGLFPISGSLVWAVWIQQSPLYVSFLIVGSKFLNHHSSHSQRDTGASNTTVYICTPAQTEIEASDISPRACPLSNVCIIHTSPFGEIRLVHLLEQWSLTSKDSRTNIYFHFRTHGWVCVYRLVPVSQFWIESPARPCSPIDKCNLFCCQQSAGTMPGLSRKK